MNAAVADWVNGFVALFYPNLCACCSTGLKHGEQYLCSHCLYDLPVTDFYKTKDNPVEQIFWGRVMIEQAMAYLFFKKGNKVQGLLHQIKYRGEKEMGKFLGTQMGNCLRNTNFANVDAVVPVPLHPDKMRKRTYNQSEWIAAGIGESLGKDLNTNTLIRCSRATSQTRKKRYERWESVDTGFDLADPDKFCGKHVLLVDDVVTTGATLEACVWAIQKSAGAKVSIAALAVAS